MSGDWGSGDGVALDVVIWRCRAGGEKDMHGKKCFGMIAGKRQVLLSVVYGLKKGKRRRETWDVLTRFDPF